MTASEKDLFFGVLIKLSVRGVEESIEIELTAAEQAAIKESEAAVRSVVNLLQF